MSSRSNRALLVFLFDLVAVALSWMAAFWIRFNLRIPADSLQLAWIDLLWVIPVYGLSFFAHGLYRGLWLFASIPDLFRLTRSVLMGALVIGVLAFLMQKLVQVPRSVVVLSPLLLIFTMSAARIGYRAWKETGMLGPASVGGRRPVLLLGAGQAGAMLAREINRRRDWRVVGFLDDDRSKRGREIFGHEVLGPVADVARIARERGVDTVILAFPSAPDAVQSRAAQLAVRAGLKVLRAPRIEELKEGRVSISNVRRIAIEDLLGRESIVMADDDVHGMISGRVVLITGAGGSIGSEICRQLVRFQPAKLVLVENSEFALYRIQEEFIAKFPSAATVGLACDVRDRARVREIFSEHGPHVVFHAAAYKHVPLMEHFNAWQALLNNVIGTEVVAEAAVDQRSEAFVFVSTDKAVNPVNVMGATKRLAEMLCQAIGQQPGCTTRFQIVRFGNVVGSAGSVIPKFQDQIERGGPVTVTHPEVTRYFMSIPEAVQLVLKAGSMGRGGEIFVLDMGQPLRILDLARDMIRLAGHSEEEVAIEFTGLRPGEKLFEEVLAPAEETRPTDHPKLRIARARQIDANDLLASLRRIAGRGQQSDEATRRILKEMVPEYDSQLLTPVVVNSAVERNRAESRTRESSTVQGAGAAPTVEARQRRKH